MTIRVVVCDDQELVRVGFVTILGAQPDIDVVGQAADGAEALRVVEIERPDVVVMDVRMPVLDGIEATRRIAGPGVEHAPKVLVVTTFNLDEYVYAALQAGASGFLLKDAPPAELAAGVRTVAAGDALLAPAVTRRLIGRFGRRLRPEGPDEHAAHPVHRLTDREREVLLLIAEGRANAEIATALVVSPETVKTHVSRILTKLDLRDRVQAVVLAYRSGLMD